MPKVSFENKIKVDLHVVIDWKIVHRILNSQLRVLYRTQQENKQTIWGIVNFMTL